MAEVATSRGRVYGSIIEGVRCFYNVPFAAPPVGELRYRPPAPHNGWTHIRDCSKWKRIEAVQDFTGGAGGEGVPFDRDQNPAMFGPDGLPTWMSEDCLYLSVYAPEFSQDDERLPVMVWIHGGGFLIGSGCSPQYNGMPSARAGRVLVVSINYRLGGLGFLTKPEAPGALPANIGLLDQIAALRWVQQEIAAFGGDAGNVSIFGESAGGMSVACLTGSPAASGLFQKAIPQSGACHHCVTADQARQVAVELADQLGLSYDEMSAETLQAVPVRTLLNAIASVKGPAGVGMFWAPVVGVGPVLPQQPLAAILGGIAKDISLFTGCCAEESRLFYYGMRPDSGLDTSEVVAQALAAQLKYKQGFEPRYDKGSALAKAERIVLDLSANQQELCSIVGDMPGQPGGGHSNIEGDDSGRTRRTQYEVFTRMNSDMMFDMPCKRLLDAHAMGVRAAGGSGRTYAYQFAWQSPISGKKGRLGSCHALEMGFHFGFVGQPHTALFEDAFRSVVAVGGKDTRTEARVCQPGGKAAAMQLPREFQAALRFMGALSKTGSAVPEAYKLADLMTDSWTSFARSGDPTPASWQSREVWPVWPVYSPQAPYTIVFGEGQLGIAQIKPQCLRGKELNLYDDIMETGVSADLSKL